MQDEIWHQFGIQNYNGGVLSVYSVHRVNKEDSWAKILDAPSWDLVLDGSTVTLYTRFNYELHVLSGTEIWRQFGIQNYNGTVLSVYSVFCTTIFKATIFCFSIVKETENPKTHSIPKFKCATKTITPAINYKTYQYNTDSNEPIIQSQHRGHRPR